MLVSVRQHMLLNVRPTHSLLVLSEDAGRDVHYAARGKFASLSLCDAYIELPSQIFELLSFDIVISAHGFVFPGIRDVSTPCSLRWARSIRVCARQVLGDAVKERGEHPSPECLPTPRPHQR